MWGKRSYSGKWHLVAEETIIEIEIPIRSWIPDGPKKKIIKAAFDCNGSGWGRDQRHEMAFKETLNPFRSGVCVYCRNRKLKELEIDTKIQI